MAETFNSFDVGNESSSMSNDSYKLIEALGNAITHFPNGKTLMDANTEIQEILDALKYDHQIELQPMSLNSIQFEQN